MKKISIVLLGAHLSFIVLGSVQAMETPQNNKPLSEQEVITQESLLEELVRQLEKTFPAETKSNLAVSSEKKNSSDDRKRTWAVRRARIQLRKFMLHKGNDTVQLVLTTVFGALNSCKSDLKTPDGAATPVIDSYLQALVKNDQKTATAVARQLLHLQDEAIAKNSSAQNKNDSQEIKSVTEATIDQQNLLSSGKTRVLGFTDGVDLEDDSQKECCIL